MKEASKYTGLHPNTLRKYIDQGVIKGVRLGKHRYVEKAELGRLMGTTKAEPKGVAVYARVSTKKQQDAGNLDGQKKAPMQIGSLSILPFLAFYLMFLSGILSLDIVPLVTFAGVLGAASAALYLLSRATFRREEILTRWK
jgi:excisionase family DNA binding protein